MLLMPFNANRLRLLIQKLKIKNNLFIYYLKN